jgi:putative transposase
MRRSRFTEEQQITYSTLKSGHSSTLFSNRLRWKVKFGGPEESEAKRLRALEDENGRQKRMLAEPCWTVPR